MGIDPAGFIGGWRNSPWADFRTAWALTGDALRAVTEHIATLGSDSHVADSVAVHRSATVEEQAILKGPCVIGPGCFVAHNAYLRGGVYLADRVIIGPSCEVKTAFFFPGSKVAHLSFVGDSIIGSAANIEAGATIANYRNERDEKTIRIIFEGRVIETGTEKFGCLVGDGVRIGANAVIAPGAVLLPDTIVPRLSLVDHSHD